jgi:hypothetical protein
MSLSGIAESGAERNRAEPPGELLVTSGYEADLSRERIKIYKCRASGRKFRTSL